jgi:hypothetical protein
VMGVAADSPPEATSVLIRWLGRTPVIAILRLNKNARRSAANGRFLVGLAGLEPAAFRPPDGRATRLRYSPTGSVHTGLPGKGKPETGNIRAFDTVGWSRMPN